MSKKAKKYPPNGRVHRAKVPGYTQINNHIFHTGMSMEAFALLVIMLQLPPNWHYTVAGLASIVSCEEETIERYLRELEALGHLIRQQQSRAAGKFGTKIWDIFELSYHSANGTENEPNSKNIYPSSDSTEPMVSASDAPSPEIPASASSALEVSAQINTLSINTKKENTLFIKKESSNNQSMEIAALIDELKPALGYDDILSDFPERKEAIDLLFALIAEAEFQSEPVVVGTDTIRAAEYREALISTEEYHIRYILQCLEKTAPTIRNKRSYLQRCLLNAYHQLEENPSLYHFPSTDSE